MIPPPNIHCPVSVMGGGSKGERGRLPRVLGGGPPAPPWATAAAAGLGRERGGGEVDRLGWGHIKILYEAPRY